MFEKLRKLEHGVDKLVVAAIGTTALVGTAWLIYHNRDNTRLRNGLADLGQRGVDLFDQYLADPLTQQGVDVARGRRVADVVIRRLRVPQPAEEAPDRSDMPTMSEPQWAEPDATAAPEEPFIPRPRTPTETPADDMPQGRVYASSVV